MLPTQPANCGKRWWQPPDFHYSFKSYGWPAGPVEGAAAAAAAASTGAGAGVGAGAVEGAASHLAGAAGAAVGAGAGGLPPRGPGFYHHYYQGYPRGFRGGRGGRPSRLVWFAVGAITAGFWYRHHERRHEDFHRYISDPNAWKHTWQHRLPSPSTQNQQSAATATFAPAPATAQTPAPSSTPVTQALQDQPKKWGCSWSEKRDAYWAKRYEEYRQRQHQHQGGSEAQTQTSTQSQSANIGPVAAPAMVSTATPSTVGSVNSAESDRRQPTNGNGNASSAEEMSRIRESIDKIWEEKKRSASGAQEQANAQAREYASRKLDKLSAALDQLRDSLRQDAVDPNRHADIKQRDEKWV